MPASGNTPDPQTVLGSVKEASNQVTGTGTANDSAVVPLVELMDPATGQAVTPTLNPATAPPASTPIAHRVNITAADTSATIAAIGANPVNTAGGPVQMDSTHSMADFTCQLALATGVSSVTVNNGGTGGTANQSNVVCPFTGGGGSGGSAQVSTNGSGAITSISGIVPGSGYSSPPTLNLANVGSPTGVQLTVVLQTPTAQATLVPFVLDPGASGGLAANYYPDWTQTQTISYTPGQAGAFAQQRVTVRATNGATLILGVDQLSAQTRFDADVIQR